MQKAVFKGIKSQGLVILTPSTQYERRPNEAKAGNSLAAAPGAGGKLLIWLSAVGRRTVSANSEHKKRSNGIIIKQLDISNYFRMI
jgi:hypothetical protein